MATKKFDVEKAQAMDLNELDYDLPPERIAQEPLKERSASRLLVVNRAESSIQHHYFHELPNFLNSQDFLVLNDSKVQALRLYTQRINTGGVVEMLILEQRGTRVLRAMVRSRGKLQAGERLQVLRQSAKESVPAEGVSFELLGKQADGSWEVAFENVETSKPHDLIEHLAPYARMPLPPYIKRERLDDSHARLDQERYQTVYARNVGSVAAPTAGFHFSPGLFKSLQEKGVGHAFVTLHVGTGTFRPIRSQNIEEHEMHDERYELSAQAYASIREAYKAKKRIVAVGTTSTRVLESCSEVFKREDSFENHTSITNLMIMPGYHFQVVDALVTNFHMPRSTLLALVMAFAGKELIRSAYERALQNNYRFLSYGDCMLIL